MIKIARFVFVFRDRCNMNCPYCYMPFIDSEAGDLKTWIRIIDILSRYSPDLVTFGGGDPFRYEDFVDLLKFCRRYNFQIHVDTNAIKLYDNLIPKIKPLIDIIGVPLDGSPQQHNQLRNYNGHYEIVVKKMRLCNDYGIPLKINTVYFPDKPGQLKYIAQTIREYSNILQWFIYEYWYFIGINAYIPMPSPIITKPDIMELQRISKKKAIYFSSVKERSNDYIFITSCGNAYTVSKDNARYIELGNILTTDSEVVFSKLSNIDEISRRASLKKL